MQDRRAAEPSGTAGRPGGYRLRADWAGRGSPACSLAAKCAAGAGQGPGHLHLPGLAQRVGCGIYAAGARRVPGQRFDREGPDRVCGNPVPGRRRVPFAQSLAGHRAYTLSQREESRGPFRLVANITNGEG